MDSVFQISANIEWQPLGDGLYRQILGYNDQLMMVKVRFDKGAIGQLHHHMHGQVTYIESGLFEATISGEQQLLKAGDGFIVPSDEVHGVVCLEAGMLVDVFNPLREDFL